MVAIQRSVEFFCQLLQVLSWDSKARPCRHQAIAPTTRPPSSAFCRHRAAQTILSRDWRSCRECRLGDTCAAPVNDAGLVHLKGLTNLQKLCLGRTQVTDTGLVHLKGMTNLASLSLWEPRLPTRASPTCKRRCPTTISTSSLSCCRCRSAPDHAPAVAFPLSRQSQHAKVMISVHHSPHTRVEL